MRAALKWLGAAVIALAAAAAALGAALGHTSPCATAPISAAGPAGQPLMKAAVYRCYGPPDVIKLESLQKPGVGEGEILVRVHAAALNPHDEHVMRGTPYLVRLGTGFGSPRNVRALATDFAGTVEAVGKAVKRFKAGDEVFGSAEGALAQYLTVPEEAAVAAKPAAMSFEQAAAIPVAGVTALQALRDLGHVRAGQKVLINGASGGVGTFAVQLAKLSGAEVTGVCSTKNLEMVRALGADHVIDYTHEDFARGTQRYDLILDVTGNRSIADYRRVLAPQGILVLIGVTPGDWLGPLQAPVQATLLELFSKQKVLSMFAHINRDDLTALAGLFPSGKLAAVIDRRYRLEQAPEAMRYLEAGHARGKLVINVD